jgi:hypothetical protein
MHRQSFIDCVSIFIFADRGLERPRGVRHFEVLSELTIAREVLIMTNFIFHPVALLRKLRSSASVLGRIRSKVVRLIEVD